MNTSSRSGTAALPATALPLGGGHRVRTPTMWTAFPLLGRHILRDSHTLCDRRRHGFRDTGMAVDHIVKLPAILAADRETQGFLRNFSREIFAGYGEEEVGGWYQSREYGTLFRRTPTLPPLAGRGPAPPKSLDNIVY